LQACSLAVQWELSCLQQKEIINEKSHSLIKNLLAKSNVV
jgi:hypothetical protein